MSSSLQGPLTLRMMLRVLSSIISTRTWVTPPREPVRPRTLTTCARMGQLHVPVLFHLLAALDRSMVSSQQPPPKLRPIPRIASHSSSARRPQSVLDLSLSRPNLPRKRHRSACSTASVPFLNVLALIAVQILPFQIPQCSTIEILTRASLTVGVTWPKSASPSTLHGANGTTHRAALRRWRPCC